MQTEHSPAKGTSPPRRRWQVTAKLRRALILFSKGILLFVITVFGYALIERYTGKAALARAEARLVARGEKLDIIDLVPSGRRSTSGSEVLRLCQLLAPHKVRSLDDSSLMLKPRSVAPGILDPLRLRADWPGWDGTKHTWEDIYTELERNNSVMRDLHMLLKQPDVAADIEFEKGSDMTLPHLIQCKRAATWFAISAIGHLRNDRLTNGIDDVEAILRLSDILHDEPILISQLVRMTLRNMAAQVTWETLAHPACAEADMKRLQQLWENARISDAPGVLRMERAIGRDAFSKLRRSTTHVPIDFEPYDPWSHIGAGAPKGLRSAFIIPMWRFAWSYRDEAKYVEQMQTIIDAIAIAQQRKAHVEFQRVAVDLERRLTAAGKSRNWRYPETVRQIAPLIRQDGWFENHTKRDLVLCAIALQRYFAKNQRYPEVLESLVPALLSKLPLDHMDGRPLRYRMENNSFVLWSVGRDGKDDHGAAASKGFLAGMDNSDLVWPRPASSPGMP